MKRILLVDDDPVVLRIYRDGLTHRGFQVETAEDGLAAMKALSKGMPDLAVLDLMMPKLSGVDVLKYIRSQPELSGLRVIVLSNSYANEIAAEATSIGVDRALLKVRCSPGKLCVVIDDIFAGRASGPDSAELLAAAQPGTLQKPPSTLPPTLGSSIPASKPPSSAQPSSPNLPSTALSPTRPPEPPAQTKPEPKMNEEELRAKTRQDFVKNGPDVCNSLKSLLASLLAAKNESERSLRLQNFYRKVHFITATSGLAECLEIAHLATVFEALLFDLMPKPGLFQPSTIRTITQGVELLTTLYGRTQEGRVPGSSRAQVLVVDDDAVCNRLVVSALRTAQLHARSVENPHLALEYLKEHPYDMILLDVDMPGMDGFETCRRLRQLPGYEKTPVVYVTGHADFMHREQSIASGAEDLIGKPIVPLELALKVVMHLLRKS